MTHSVTDTILDHLRKHSGWVGYQELLTLAPQHDPQRLVVADDTDAWNSDNARGSAWYEATGSVEPDTRALQAALRQLEDGGLIESHTPPNGWREYRAVSKS